MKLLGQVDVKPLLVAAAMSIVSWFGGAIWTRYGAAEDLRRQVQEHERLIVKVVASVERVEAAVEGMRAALPPSGVRTAGGKR